MRMPARPKTSRTRIVKAARKLVERHGRHGFSMTEVAVAVGIRAPSLYSRFSDREELVAAVELEYWHGMARALARAPSSKDPVRALKMLARAYRAFAKADPKGYALIYDASAERTEEGTRARAAALGVAMPSFVALVGEGHALTAARVLTPFLHGFVSMELAGAFRLGPGLDEAFDRGVTAILAGLEVTFRAK